jgi:hypothetical protein
MAQGDYELVRAIAAPLGTLVGVALGWWLGQRTRIEERRRKVVDDIADVFAKEAGKWADVSFQIDDRFKEWHRASIYRLSGHTTFVERHYPEKWEKIEPIWQQYSSTSAGTYLKERRADFIEALYVVATELRAP